MQKSILITCTILTALSLMAFSYINWSHPTDGVDEAKEAESDLFYRVGNRWWSNRTKEELKQVKSIHDFFNPHEDFISKGFSNVTISILHNDKDVRDIERFEMGQSEILNKAQLELLHSSAYSTNIRITTLCTRTHTKTGQLRTDSLVHYMTIIPEKEAQFEGGHDALIEYLKESSKDKTAIIKKDKLQPGKYHFTVTKEGTISNIKLNSTSGYPSVDEELIKIISNIPQNWKPAQNTIGEKVDQEFVFFFGMEGC